MFQRLITPPKNKSFFIFGPRQTGKTVFVESWLPSKNWQANLLLNDTYFTYLKNPSQFRADALYQIQNNHVECIFLDEVQKIPNLLDEVHDLIQKTHAQFVLTGSSARKLKRKGTNLLGGRALQYHIFPFIHQEISEIFQLDQVLRFGSLPGIFVEPDHIKIESLNAYSQTYLKEEIAAEGIVRNLSGFTRFLEVAAAAFGEMTSYSNIGRECALSPRTVQGYYDILEDTLIGYRLSAWHKSVRKQLKEHPKFYFFDNGVVNSINRLLKDEISPLVRGRLFEQWLINEIRARLHYEKSENRMYYWRTNNNQEVDLLVAKRDKIIAAIEIKASRNITNQHASGLKSFYSENPNVPGMIVCDCDNPFFLGGKIEVLPWKIFLTEKIPVLV